jgi:SpoVK/Ycf46/Vps4 family AAA+-type ATPase
MNFIRKKPPTALDELTELYNNAANKTIANLAFEQNGDFKRAVDGWKALHTQLLFKMDLINKAFSGHSYSADELSIREGIEDLLNKGIEHQERVEGLYNASLPQQKEPVLYTSSTTYTVPTLRSASPHNFTVRRQIEPQAQKPRMLKTLRAEKPHKFSIKNNFSRPSDMSKSAATTLLAAQKPAANWAPSKSLSENKFNRSEDIDIFDKSFEEGFADFDMQVSRDETLRQLEAMGQQSQQSRRVNEISLTNLSVSSKRMSPITTTSNPSVTSLNPTPSSQSLRPSLKSGSRSTSNLSLPNSSPALAAVKKVALPQQKAASTSRLPTKKALKPPVPQVRKTSGAVPKRAAVKPIVPIAKPSVKQAPVKRAAKPAPKPTQPKPGATTTTRPQAQTRLQAKKTQTPLDLERSRSESPSREETKDTETIDSDDPGDVKEMQLSSKEVREKMEDQIIEEIRGIDYNAAKQIFNEIVVRGDEVHWDDIAGLETAKNSLKETVVYPFLRPDLFSGLREPARGMLLFGPPGTGKTMLARAVATESNSTFFSISASSLTSKYLGESEKLVRALFQLAKKLSPSIIFVDEIDSLLSSRNESGENESSRRIKNEFLVQWSDLTHAAAGKDTGEDLQRVLVLAATNLPWAIDEAARRRFVRRQYIPLPEAETRLAQIVKLLAHQKHTLDDKHKAKLVELTDGFSGSDITALAKDAAMGPLRSLGDKLLSTAKSEIRPIGLEDFEASLKYIRPSVSKENLGEFDEWAKKFGSSGV